MARRGRSSCSGKHTPGYQDKSNERYMLFFAGNRPRAYHGAAPPVYENVPDANLARFTRALSNIELKSAKATRARRRCAPSMPSTVFWRTMEFRIGSGPRGIHEARQRGRGRALPGGQYGVWTSRPSPGWQFDDGRLRFFQGQREAAIREREAGLTLIRPHFQDVPTAISVDAGFADEMWVKERTDGEHRRTGRDS